MRILISSFQALGNGVLTTPLLANLKRAWPTAEIDIVCRPPASELFAACPYVNRCFLYDRDALRGRGRIASAAFSIAFLARTAARRYDAVLDLHGGPRSAAIALFSGSPVRVGYANRVRGVVFNRKVVPRKLAFDPSQPRQRKRHEADHLLEFARALGIEPMPSPIEVFPRPGPAPIPVPYSVLHPGSSDPRKNWPMRHYLALARAIESRLGLEIRFSVGPMDGAVRAALEREGVEAERIVHPRDLASLVTLIAGASLFVGNDSGPMHLAAALGRPTVGIFGPTDEAFTGPRAPEASLARVAALDLPCRPCLRWEVCKERACLRDLASEIALEAACEVVPRFMPRPPNTPLPGASI